MLSLVCFALRQYTPGDPVRRLLPAGEARQVDDDPLAYDRAYRRAAVTLGLDRPAFYLTLANGALPDTLHRIVRPQERAMVRALTLANGNWPATQRYYQALRQVAYQDGVFGPDYRRLLLQDDPARIATLIGELPTDDPVRSTFTAYQSQPTRSRLLLPALRWHGSDNQYHHWLMAFLRGDPGRSLTDGRPVAEKIGPALKWTALINGLAIGLVFLIAVPTGLRAAGYAGGWFDRLTTVGMFLLFGIPSFWVATLLANFFTTPAFGMDFFPSMGVGELPPDANWWTALRIRAAHLFLPVVCLAYPSWAYVSRHLRRAAAAELTKPYVKTARLKGLAHDRILWSHVLRNAAFPLITLAGSLLPALLAGSVLIERIFNLPGMGQLLYNAALADDWPVIITLVLLNGVLTAIGLLLADLGYRLADPRVRLAAAKSSVG